MPDAMGHAVSIKAPGGWVCRISPDGKDWTMIASGFRNPVDLAINREGELHPLLPGAMRGDGAAGLKKQILSSNGGGGHE